MLHKSTTSRKADVVPAVSAAAIEPWTTQLYAALPKGVRPRLVVMATAAAYLGIDKSMFKLMVMSGSMPAARFIGACRLWDLRQIDEAVDRLPIDYESRFDWEDPASGTENN